jgi:hypothetical protein
MVKFARHCSVLFNHVLFQLSLFILNWSLCLISAPISSTYRKTTTPKQLTPRLIDLLYTHHHYTSTLNEKWTHRIYANHNNTLVRQIYSCCSSDDFHCHSLSQNKFNLSRSRFFFLLLFCRLVHSSERWTANLGVIWTIRVRIAGSFVRCRCSKKWDEKL